MTSITTFAYGLTVRATDLVNAASAWPQLEPVFHFFDLIQLRRREGQLAGRGVVTLIPVGVWDQVKEHLVTLEMEDSADEIARNVLKPGESHKSYCLLHRPERYTWRDLWLSNIECHDCSRIQNFVAKFGLAHPLDRFIRADYGVFPDESAVAVVSIPKRFYDGDSGSCPTFSATTEIEDEPEGHAIIDVDLSLPPDHNLRFIRFIETFELQVVNVHQVTQASVSPQAAAAVGKGKSKESFPRNLVVEQCHIDDTLTREIKPKWSLYTFVTKEDVCGSTEEFKEEGTGIA